MLMPKREFNAGSYRFGFNGMEKDDEVKGTGNSLDFGARMYDTRLGKWFSTDPAFKKYPGISPYSFGANNPIYYVDQNGKWLGVTFVFGEISIGAGVGYGVYYVEQTGLAYDDVGKTHFTARTFLHIYNQNLQEGSRNPNVILGADVNVISGNIKQDWSADTYFESIGTSAVDFKIPGSLNSKLQVEVPSLKVGFGISGSISQNSITIGAGLSAGLTFNFISNEILESISLTDAEASKVNGMSNLASKNWTMGTATPSVNKAGEITGYTAPLMIASRDANGNIIQTNTGMTLSSGVKRNADGSSSPNNVWASDNYVNEASKIEKCKEAK